MPYVSMVFGFVLIGVGVWGMATSEHEWPRNATALIPAVAGVILVIAGAIALVERFLKHAMHLAAVIGVLGLLAGAGRFIQLAVTKELNLHKPTHQALLTMTVVCLVFVGLCVNSF